MGYLDVHGFTEQSGCVLKVQTDDHSLNWKTIQQSMSSNISAEAKVELLTTTRTS